jgi:plasmid stabilization system protein ParE
MRLELHSQVASDIARIMDYYEDVAGRQLADEFYSELRSCFQKAADSPEIYDVRTRDLRRVNRKISLSLSVPNRQQSSAHIGCASSPETIIVGSLSALTGVFRF